MPNYNRLVPRDEADRQGWAPRDQARGGEMSGGAKAPAIRRKARPSPFRSMRAGDCRRLACFASSLHTAAFAPSICEPDARSGIARLAQPANNGPLGIPSMLPINIGTPNNGGSVVTAGGLIFIAAATDNLIRAIDIETGEQSGATRFRRAVKRRR